MIKKAITSILILSTFSVLLFSEDIDLSSEHDENKTLGLIFNTSNIFLDLEGYQGGIGLKLLLNEQSALRGLFDGYYSNSLNTVSLTLGIVYEEHLSPLTRISAYWGAFLNAGFISQRIVIDETNWTTDRGVSLCGGPIFGVEFFLLEFLSLFAEYNISADFRIESNKTTIDGVSAVSKPDYLTVIDTGIGNESSIGITIYLDEVLTFKE